MMAAQVVRDDAGELERLEHLISDRLSRTFVEVGQALARIRDEDLYREAGYHTFEVYCRERWDMSRPYAYQQIAAASVVSAIADKQLPPPSNEAQARELTKLPEADRLKAWRDAVKASDSTGVPVTARLVREMVKQRLPEPKSPAPESRREPVSSDLDCIRGAWAQLSASDRSAFLRGIGAVSANMLDSLRLQREADQEYRGLRKVQREMPMQTRGSRLAGLVLDGGELAMARLGVNWASSADGLKQAWKRASLEAHPDRGGSHERQSQVNKDHALLAKWFDKETPL